VAGGTALPEAEVETAAERRPARGWLRSHPGLLVFLIYLAAAVGLTWRLWAGLGTVSVAGDPGPADNDLMAWFMRYAATAVAHGHLPALVTTALNAPRGFPLMWNNSVLFPAVLLSPVTLLAGPLASLTALTTLGYAGSAAAMYWLLRRYGASVLAAALGGAVLGFSPGMVNAGLGHYGLQFAVATPLMIEALAAIVTGRGRWLWAGVRLGLFAAAQLYTGEEMLTDVTITGLVLVVVLAASRPSAARARLGAAIAGLATAAVVALIVAGYGLWVQFHGPLTEHGTPWHIERHGNPFGAFVNPQSQLLFHTASSAAYAVSYRAETGEYVAYLGPPLLILVAAVTIWYWRDLRVRSAGIVWAVLEVLSLGVNGPLLPLHWLQGLPLVADMFPSRMSILADGAAAAVLAFGLDLARSPARRPAGRVQRIAAVLIAVLAMLPLVPRPVAALTGAQVPAGWDTVFTRLNLPPDASVLVVPLPYSQQGEAMLWQADTGQPARLVAGWFLGPDAAGHGDDAYWGPTYTNRTVQCLDGLWQGTVAEGDLAGSDCPAAVASALSYWHPAAVVADTSPGTPLGQFLIKELGQPTVQDGQLLGWRNP
jgi:hypothetical protein